MASRLNVAPIFLAHWRGLTRRQPLPDGDFAYSPDSTARALTLAVPLVAGAAALVWLRSADDKWSLPVDFAGVAIAAASLLSAALVAAFTQLAGWREKLRDQDRTREKPLRAMVDEAVGHVLLSMLEAVLIVASAAASMMLAGWPARLACSLTFAAAAHVIFLFMLLIPRLYSAYVQTNDVDEHMDGFTRV